jgi:tetratricopeptide (TPR) repeat protein
MGRTTEEAGREELYPLEERQLFSRSMLWGFQQHYYYQEGVTAWRQGQVPHYITSNPAIANSYAEIVFAFLCEQQRLAPGGGDEPLYVCELGAGPGRFAFHFLRRLTHLCELARLPPGSFRYVLTDFTPNNLEFWRSHTRFQPFFESGALDVALFDINRTDRLDLQVCGKAVTVGSLRRPLVVIANYVLDSVPQELLYFNDLQCHPCLVSLFLNKDPNDLRTAAELFEHLRYSYDYQEPAEALYPEPELQQLLADYRRTLKNTFLLFPATGLRCLQRLKALSTQGILLLSADKGSHRLEELEGSAPPALVCHGSCFSLNVNYHAFKAFCEQSGGVAFFPASRHTNIAVSGLLMVARAADYLDTRRAYQRHVQDFSPDDFYTVIEHAQLHVAEMSVTSILAHLRLSYYDSHQFACYLPRLMELASGLDDAMRRGMTDAVNKVWELYFPLGETHDLADQIASLLYEMDDYAGALTYFERSVEIYGEHAGTLFNMAACCQLTGQPARAESLLRKVLRYDPDNQQARALLAGAEA